MDRKSRQHAPPAKRAWTRDRRADLQRLIEKLAKLDFCHSRPSSRQSRAAMSTSSAISMAGASPGMTKLSFLGSVYDY
ncbi:hypothetical protein [Labrys okinawensis]|uniref:hypothetical protein n=1 Tax=Labrys okinawensis TaxID=346911 RepID=UPI0011B21E1F|nr:hypothetical protein [Labrys okinawensis]